MVGGMQALQSSVVWGLAPFYLLLQNRTNNMHCVLCAPADARLKPQRKLLFFSCMVSCTSACAGLS